MQCHDKMHRISYDNSYGQLFTLTKIVQVSQSSSYDGDAVHHTHRKSKILYNEPLC